MSTSQPPFAGFDAVRQSGPDSGNENRAPEPPASLAIWVRDLALGARFAAGGGREGWARTGLTAIGVGLGVALLLLAAAVPAMMTTRDDKSLARSTNSGGYLARPTDSTLLVADAGTTYHDKDITGVLVHPEGPKTEPPPGVGELPPAGHMLVSPALKRLLASSPLLRERIPYPIDGTIGQAGLLGPAELYFYAGSDKLTAYDANYQNGNADRLAGFGYQGPSEAMGPTFDLLLIIVVIVLLLPVAVFIGTAVRLGGERRDRRLAALRLVGADIRTTRRIAAGEALFGALLGLLLGVAFFLIGRQLAAHITLQGISAFPSDLTPQLALTVLVTLAVPVSAVAVSLLRLRGTVIEPLGVVRQVLGRRRRLWWRLLIPAVGLALLAPLFGTVNGTGDINTYQIATGTVLLLVGVTAVLPWVVESFVGRLRGGPVAWQLATRRLQLNSSASARMVSGVTVAVAGAIALQMLFAGVEGDFSAGTGADPARAQAIVGASASNGRQTQDHLRRIAATKGIQAAYGYASGGATQADASTRQDVSTDAYLPLVVGDCPTLRQLANLTSCAAGSVFLVPPDSGQGDERILKTYASPGARIDLNAPVGDTYTGKPELWTVPAHTPTVTGRISPSGSHEWGLFATPQALDAGLLNAPGSQIMVSLDPKQPDALEYLRNTAEEFGVAAYVRDVRTTKVKASYAQLRRGLFAGAVLTMALIGGSLLVTMLEQLRDRRRLLAVLVAFGTRRSALAWSVLWQTAIPVVLGLLLACVGGVGLGAALLAMVGRRFQADWSVVAAMSATGAGVVFAVTLLSLPPLWRLMRPDGLRTE